MQTRPPPTEDSVALARCLDCWYVLEGLDRNRCPECGRPFDLGDPLTFTTKPPFLFWRLWLPGLALAAGSGVLVTLILLPTGSVGFGLTVATPLMIGALVGYRSRSMILVSIVLVISAIVAVLATLLMLNVMGLLCGLMTFAAFGMPALLGLLLGAALRKVLKKSGYQQAVHLPVVLLVAMPIGVGLAELPFRRTAAIESVSTTRVLPMSVAEAWGRLAFYEDLPGDKPFLLRIAGPQPVRTIITRDEHGETRKCVYERGHITKRVTQKRPPTRLAFDVIDQQVGEERSVRIRNGRFEFESLSPEQTRVTLTTRYEPKLRPRICWRPLERWVTHSVHNHVLSGMAAGRASAFASIAPEPE